MPAENAKGRRLDAVVELLVERLLQFEEQLLPSEIRRDAEAIEQVDDQADALEAHGEIVLDCWPQHLDRDGTA